MDIADLARRIERIESHQQIQQLPIRYAIAVDSRDTDAWVNLFIEDVNCGRTGKGRAVLKTIIDPNIRTFYRSIHQICGHQIDFVDDDRATGKVYCRAEHEDGDQWVVMAICYFDQYERREGKWFFVRRQEKHWYSTDVEQRPQGPNFQRWDKWPDAKPELPHHFVSWKDFWDKSNPEDIARLTVEP